MAMELWQDRQHVWLRSRVHGGYLHADDDGVGVSVHRGFRVMLRNYGQTQMKSIMWQVIGASSGNAALLRNVGGRYLRANGRILRWNRCVSVDEFENESTMMHWIVERIPGLAAPVRPPMSCDTQMCTQGREREIRAWQLAS